MDLATAYFEYVLIDLNFRIQTTVSRVGHQNIMSKSQSGLVISKRRSIPLMAVPTTTIFRKISKVIRQRGTMKTKNLIRILVGFSLLILSCYILINTLN